MWQLTEDLRPRPAGMSTWVLGEVRILTIMHMKIDSNSTYRLIFVLIRVHNVFSFLAEPFCLLDTALWVRWFRLRRSSEQRSEVYS